MFIVFVIVRVDAAVQDSAFYGPGNGSILLNNVACVGSENRLVDCQHTTNHNCVHGEDVGVMCNRTCKQYF